jgi:hypothetical protein
VVKKKLPATSELLARHHQGESYDAVVHFGNVVQETTGCSPMRRSAGLDDLLVSRRTSSSAIHSGAPGFPVPRHRDRAAGGFYAAATAGGNDTGRGAQSVPGGSGSGLTEVAV